MEQRCVAVGFHGMNQTVEGFRGKVGLLQGLRQVGGAVQLCGKACSALALQSGGANVQRCGGQQTKQRQPKGLRQGLQLVLRHAGAFLPDFQIMGQVGHGKLALLGLQQRLGEDGQAQTAAVQRGQRGERAQFLLQCQQGFLKGAAVVPQILSAGFAAMLRTQTGTQERYQMPSRAPGKAHVPIALRLELPAEAGQMRI